MTTTTEFRLPSLADSVTSVRLSQWLKQVGDRVDIGEAIVEVETDKTNVELEAPAAGVIQAIHVAAGTDGLEAGTVLAVIADGPPAAGTAGTAVDPAVATTPPEGARRSHGQGARTADGDEFAATPLARRMAAVAELGLAEVRGSGRDGRITKRDVDRALDIAPHSSPGTVETVPPLCLRVECVADAALGLLASAARQRQDRAPTLTDLVIRASAFALRMMPRANASWVDGHVRPGESVDIAVAVNTPTGVVTPIVRGADRKDLAAIAMDTRGLLARAHAGQLGPDECAGATFIVSHVAMRDVESRSARVNPPARSLLAVGAVVSRPVVAGRQVGVGQVLTCTLSADQRVLDGVLGDALLTAIRDYIEEPGLMLV